MKVLQTFALPLGHVTIMSEKPAFGAGFHYLSGAADEARTRYLHLGKVALYQMSYGRIKNVFFTKNTQENGASDRNRTNDTGIFSPLLYRLSYRGISGAIIPAPSHSYFKRGPRKNLRNKVLWGRGGISEFVTAVLLVRLPDKRLTFRRSDPDRARTDDPQRDRLVL